MKMLVMFGIVPRQPATGGARLERKLASGEHELMKSEVKMKWKGDLWPWRSTKKLPGMTSVMNEL